MILLSLITATLVACNRAATGLPQQLTSPTESLKLEDISVAKSLPDGFFLLGREAHEDHVDLYDSRDGRDWQKKEMDIYAATAGPAGILGSAGKVQVHHQPREGYGYSVSTSLSLVDSWTEHLVGEKKSFQAGMDSNGTKIFRLEDEGIRVSDDGGKGVSGLTSRPCRTARKPVSKRKR